MWVYNVVVKGGCDLLVVVKYVFGFGVVVVGYLVFMISGCYVVDGCVLLWFMVWGYGLYLFGELLVSGFGFVMIVCYVLVCMSGFMMGVYFVVMGVL